MSLRISKKVIFILIALLLVAGVGVTVYLTQQQQDIRQRASEPTPTICVADQPTDTMLILDRSGSMASPTSENDSTSRLISAQKAGSAFLDILAKRTENPLHAVSLSTISSDTIVKVEQTLTRDLAKVKTALNALTPAGGTCIECGLDTAAKDFETNERDGVKNIAVMLTDGGATQFIGGKADTSAANRAEAERRAFVKAKEIHEKFDVTFYTIGFGEDAKDQLLTNIATTSGGQYFFAPDAQTLSEIYTKIATIIGKGSISGSKFADTNANGILDADEVKLNNWRMSLFSQGSDTPLQTMVTDAQGDYTFSGLCDGNYTVKEETVEGWIATGNKTEQIVTLSKAENVKDVNFANSQEVPPAPVCAVTEAICLWDPVPGVTNYTVTVEEILPESGATQATVLGPTTVNAPLTQITFSATPGKTYECKVEAVNSCGTGPEGTGSASCPLPPETPTPTPTLPIPTNSPTPTLTLTPVPTKTPTPIPTNSPTPTPTLTPIPTNSPTPIPTNSPVPPTATAIPPTATPTPTTVPGQPTNTPTPTIESPGSALQTITIAGGIILTIIGALVLFAL